MATLKMAPWYVFYSNNICIRYFMKIKYINQKEIQLYCTVHVNLMEILCCTCINEVIYCIKKNFDLIRKIKDEAKLTLTL